MYTPSIYALADVVWPALLFASYERGVAAIVTGLIAEFLVLRYVFPMDWKKAVLVDATMNFASSLVGAFAIPLGGLLWELYPGVLIYKMLNTGTFNPITWAATCVMAIFISTGIETCVVRYAFHFQITKRRFWAVALANLLCTIIAYLSMIKHPPQF